MRGAVSNGRSYRDHRGRSQSPFLHPWRFTDVPLGLKRGDIKDVKQGELFFVGNPLETLGGHKNAVSSSSFVTQNRIAPTAVGLVRLRFTRWVLHRRDLGKRPRYESLLEFSWSTLSNRYIGRDLRGRDLTEWIGPVADAMRIDRIPVGLVPEEDPATS